MEETLKWILPVAILLIISFSAGSYHRKMQQKKQRENCKRSQKRTRHCTPKVRQYGILKLTLGVFRFFQNSCDISLQICST